ncbi:TolC family protein [Pontibacter sp. G13]|uniref:TolC family protein n=1 Tax=Pontibacter sp. G13 TaxID=3074898 RepID=UPI002888FC71|nr:TolC family protein [Pontibacter sp. G13]WNJ20482.1 TolC family protein [Pontibacter sp. G13]
MKSVSIRAIYLLILIPLIGLPNHGISQSALDQYVELGLSSNLAIQQSDLQVAKRQQALREAKGLFLPYVSFQASYTVAAGGRSLDFPVGDLLNPVYATLNELTETNQFPTNIENVNEQFLPHNFQETYVRVVQPVFNSDILFNRRAQDDLLKAEGFQREAFQRELVRDIKTAYFAYLQTEDALRINRETRVLLEEILRVNRSLVDNDKATRDVIYNAEFELRKLDKEQAQTLQRNQSARAYFNFLLNRPLDSDIEIDTTWFNPEQQSLINLEVEAPGRRPEIAQFEASINAVENQEKVEQWGILPKVNAIFDMGFQGFGYDFANQEYAMARVGLQWDIFQGFRRDARRQQAALDRKTLEKRQEATSQQIQLQVREAWYQLAAAQASLEASKSGVQDATAAFDIISKKYRESQANWLELLEARNRFTLAQISQSIDTYSVWARMAELEYAAGTAQIP